MVMENSEKVSIKSIIKDILDNPEQKEKLKIAKETGQVLNFTMQITKKTDGITASDLYEPLFEAAKELTD